MTYSWWNDTPWPIIREYTRLTLSSRQFADWLKREDVVARREREEVAAWTERLAQGFDASSDGSWIKS